MKKTEITVVSLLFFLLIPSSILASQAMPRYGINPETRECSEFFMGDECVSCTLPEGWQMIDEFECPVKYKQVKAASVCHPVQSKFCCTVDHSGLAINCQDVVVNDVLQKCAFVDNIYSCATLPRFWHQAEEIEYWGKVCPSIDYQWLDATLDCAQKK